MKIEDYTPVQAMQEELELMVKAGRRCAYDLAHAVDYMPSGDFLTERLRANVTMWKSIFNPGNDGKNYRHRLHFTIMDLETEVKRLQKLCEKHNIDHKREGTSEIPF